MAAYSGYECGLFPYGTPVMHKGEIYKIVAHAVPLKGHQNAWKILLPQDGIPEDTSGIGYVLKPLGREYENEKTVPVEEVRPIRPS